MITSEISSSDITNPSKTFKADHTKSDAFIFISMGCGLLLQVKLNFSSVESFLRTILKKGTIQMNDSMLKHRRLRYMLAQ